MLQESAYKVWLAQTRYAGSTFLGVGDSSGGSHHGNVNYASTKKGSSVKGGFPRRTPTEVS